MLRADALQLGDDRTPSPLTILSKGFGFKAQHKVASRIADMGYERPYVLTTSRAGVLLDGLAYTRLDLPPDVLTELQARRYAARAAGSGADVIVAAGGGRTLDLGKVAAKFAGMPLIAIPTQLSHDGLASPVSILTDALGGKVSVEVDAPAAVLLSLPLLVTAPQTSFVAGLGDLISNEFALRDWALAEERGRDQVAREAWLFSDESLLLVEALLDEDPSETSTDPAAVALLGTALVNSGMAMLIAGSSRPASGAEHKISHAIDTLYGGRALHGAQVAFGSVLATHLYGCSVDPLSQRLRRLGLPATAQDLGLTKPGLRTVLAQASAFRPDRYTILDETISEGTVDDVTDAIWRFG